MWIIKARHCISPEVTARGFKKCCKYDVVDGTVMTCGMAGKRVGMFVVSVRKMKALTVKMETVTMMSKGR